MNLTGAPSYVLEEVNVARMQLVNRLILEDLERGGIVPDNRGEIHLFRCVACHHYATAVDAHVGFTQAVIRCPWCYMPAGETNHPRKPIPPDHQTITHVEFYRPLTEVEVEEFIVSAETKAKLIVRALGGNPSDPDGDLRVSIQNAEATRLLNGLLMYRDLVNDPEGG